MSELNARCKVDMIGHGDLFGSLQTLVVLLTFVAISVLSGSANGFNTTANNTNTNSTVSNHTTNTKPGSLKRDLVHQYGYANFVKHENACLNVTAAFSVSVRSPGACGYQCAIYPKGLSFNFRPNPMYHGIFSCDVLETDKYNDSDKFLVNQKGVLHYSIHSACESYPCMNDATCKSLYEQNDYTCVCKPGFGGTHCETEINECASNPCVNQGVCTDLFAKFKCSCLPGFSGTRCEIVSPGTLLSNGANVCSYIKSYNFAYMVSYHVTHRQHYTYGCGWFGWWRCNDHRTAYGKAYRTAYKKNYMVSYKCCAGWKSAEHSAECTINIDECVSKPCLNGATCNDLVNGYNCTCAAGYVGTHCETNIDECASNPCQNGGSCTDGINSYTCTCVAGYTGTNCETNIDECASGPCDNGGTCTDGINGYTCACVAGYTGTNCETNINECASGPCQNGGSCTDGINSYTCTCAAGYTGTNCEKMSPKLLYG